MGDWIYFLLNAKARNETAIVITVASTKGSVPREAGTKMVVTGREVHGTIGGGHLEFKAIAIAKGMIGADGPRALHRFPLGATLGQCCGGVVNLLFEPVPADAGWVEGLASRIAPGNGCILVTPVTGDARVGKMILDTDNDAWSIAGGSLGSLGSLGSESRDDEAREIARTMRRTRQMTLLKTMPANAFDPEQTCFFDLHCTTDFDIVLFGAGHVGRALVKVLSELDCTITWVDSREDTFPTDVAANVKLICTDVPEIEIDAARQGSYFLVMTHSHALDLVLSEQILQRLDFAYFGLIGSQSKRRQFERRLLDRGISTAQLAQMHCPIGAAGIAGKEPATIAIAVAAEILQRRSELSNAVMPATIAARLPVS